jgi:hypothetical protein
MLNVTDFGIRIRLKNVLVHVCRLISFSKSVYSEITLGFDGEMYYG